MGISYDLFPKRSIERLKQDAKALKKKLGISHIEALNRIAKEEGFSDWQALSDALDKKTPIKEQNGLVEENCAFLSSLGIDYALLQPTENCLKKSIIDAVGPVRTFFSTYGYHDYINQKQGPEGKKIKSGIIVTDSKTFLVNVSLYRPKTKMGDPRIWISHLTKFINPNDTIALILDKNILHIINISQIHLAIQCKDFFDKISKQSNLIAEELLTKLKKISASGTIRASTVALKADTAVGMAVEEALGIKPNSSKNPDYKGIELKAARNLSKNRSTLFAQVADWSDSNLKSSAEMVDKYGYERDNDLKLYCTVKTKTSNSQGLILIVDEENDLVWESHDKDGKLLVWTGALLRQRLKEKHGETFWIEAESITNEGGCEYFKLKKIIHTKNPLTNQLLPMIREGFITLDHLIKRKNKTGNAQEKGPLFKIQPDKLHLLFPDPIEYKL